MSKEQLLLEYKPRVSYTIPFTSRYAKPPLFSLPVVMLLQMCGSSEEETNEVLNQLEECYCLY